MKILVIEDEKRINDLIKAGLESERFVVDATDTGDKGLLMAQSSAYDTIILDNVLPKKSGLEICQELRKIGNHTPIIILSVKSEVYTKTSLLNAGADDYLIKPFSMEELLARIRALLRRPQQIRSDILRIDDLEMDLKKHQVRRGKRDIKLTRKEFLLLEYLFKNEDIALSKDMIMEHVWDMHVDPFSNTIEAHVASLRKKVDFAGKRKLIQTISGIGYKISTAN